MNIVRPNLPPKSSTYTLVCGARKLREDQNLTIQELSDRTGIPTSTIARIEKGGSPRLIVALQLSFGLGEPIEKIFSLVGYHGAQPGSVTESYEEYEDGSIDF